MFDLNIKKLLKDYDKKLSAYDELWIDDQHLHEHWLGFVRKLVHLGLPTLQQRNVELQRLLKDSGVSYNVYDESKELIQPWKLDPIPFLIAPEIWSSLEKGIRQRVVLMDLLLKDIYGDQKVVKDGQLPMELLYSDRNFLRACHPFPKNPFQKLLMYAADISRSPDGRLWVIGDRTQAPSGWSYSMVNRIALARIIPELFIHSKVKKIIPYFQQIRNSLLDFSPREVEQPLVVLLTPGQFNETYFEHAYLSSLQGYTLVTGNDLMVKDKFLWLKTLGGLEKVDVVVRHVDDHYCDPLSLRPDSQLGVSGLLEVVRQGNVTIANPLGSGVLENPGLMAFMPNLCKYYLGEGLIVPNIATWWCGQEKQRDYVLSHIDELIIKRIDRRSGQKTQYGTVLTKAEKEQLKAEIKATPYAFIGQEQAIFSTSPSLTDEGLEPRNTVLRCFGFAEGSNNYKILPGGLTRSAPQVGNKHISYQSGSLGKDTWVITDQALKKTDLQFKELVPKYTALGLEKLSSSTASNMFWVGRYMSRTKLTINVVRIILRYLTEIENFEDPIDQATLKILLQSLTHSTLTYPGFVGEEGAQNLEFPIPEVKSVILDPTKIGGIAYNIQMWKRSANTIRNLWSTDTWRIFDKVDSINKEIQANQAISLRDLRQIMDDLIDAVVASFGFTQSTLSQEEGGPLFEVGIDLEDGMMRSALLRSALTVRQDNRVEEELLQAMLLATSSLNTYRHRYRATFQMPGVLELTLLNATYPGSLAAGLARLADNLDLLPQKETSGRLRLDQQEILRAITALKLSDPYDLSKSEASDMLRGKLDFLLSEIRQGLVETSNRIVNTFFSHTDYKSQRSEYLFDPDF